MKRLLVALWLTVALTACENLNRKSPIPDTPVAMELVLLRDAPELNTIGNYKIYTMPPFLYQYIGYGGILLFHDFNDEISAFDLACPHEAQNTIRVDSLADGGIVTCRHCLTSYDISYGIGHPIKGVSKHALRKYKVRYAGNTIRITRN